MLDRRYIEVFGPNSKKGVSRRNFFLKSTCRFSQRASIIIILNPHPKNVRVRDSECS